ncbi:increased loss of mitochondrial DNA protein 1 [Scheffersomyces coipomensis]|uniref:increased loss of mitochondrial DNA protein 1 n=1 Tax=Scheffersomyces coipomensis TaxID=1788519 RepID=UPI00315D2074
MQFFTAKSLLYVRIVFLIALTFFLVKDSELIFMSGFVILLGQAMELPHARIDPNNPLLGVLAIAFGSLAVTDVVPLIANNLDYFESVVPVRLTIAFGIACYTYFFKDSPISNGFVFTYAFFEIWLNFIIFNNLRDEKYYRVKQYIEENAEAIRQAHDDQVRVSSTDDRYPQ